MNSNAVLPIGFWHATEHGSCLFSFREKLSHPSELIRKERKCDLDLAAGFLRSSSLELHVLDTFEALPRSVAPHLEMLLPVHPPGETRVAMFVLSDSASWFCLNISWAGT